MIQDESQQATATPIDGVDLGQKVSGTAPLHESEAVRRPDGCAPNQIGSGVAAPTESHEGATPEPPPGLLITEASGPPALTTPHAGAIPEPPPGILITEMPGPPAQTIGDGLPAQTLARVLKLEAVVRDLVTAQSRRSKAIEDRVDSLQEALMSQVGGIESHYRNAVATVDLRYTTGFNGLKSRVDAAEAGRLEAEKRASEAESETEYTRAHLDTYRQVWQSAPLMHRLKFIRELLPEEHPLQPVLKEAAALEDLRRRGRDLETWLTNYPSLFADAVQSLDTGAGNRLAASNSRESKIDPVEVLAFQTLEEAKSTLGGTLQALGITWIAPAPGEMVLSEHEVIGDEASQQADGRIAALRRRGFRVQGRVAMPAQVTRAVAAGRQIAPGELGTADEPLNPTDRTDPTDPTNTTEPHPFAGREVRNAQVTVNTATEAPAAPVVNTTQTVSAANQATAQGGNAPHEQPLQTGPAEGQILPVQIVPVHQEIQTARPPTPDPPRPVTEPFAPLTITGDMPDWLRMLVQRTHGCDSQPVLRLVYQIVKLVNLPGLLNQSGATESAAATLTDALTPLLPLLGLRYADGLPDIDAQWGAVLMETRDPLTVWLNERLQVTVLAPVRGQMFDSQTMEAIETRRTVHESENETVSRVESIGVIWNDRPLVRACVVRYATEGAG